MTYCKANSCYDSTNYSWEDYCSYHEKCLQRLRRTYSSSFRNVEALDTFETWFNKNCGWVVTYDYSSSSSYPYYVWIVIYEPKYRSMSENLSAIKHNNFSSLESAKNEAIERKDKLKYSDNPILSIHPRANSYVSFDSLITSPFVVSRNLPFEPKRREYDDNSLIYESSWEITPAEYPDDPENYLKTLDIVKVRKSTWGNEYCHFGVYLGGGKICHFTDLTSKKSTDGMKVIITGWRDFIKGIYEDFGGEIVRIHPLIPFKNYQEIAKNIAWDEYNNYGNLRYCLANNNCEHYVNSRIFGLDYSRQVKERPVKALDWSHYVSNYEKCSNCKRRIVNKGESGNFVLSDRLGQSLSEKNNYRSQEIERKYLQEVPTKDNSCRVM